MARNPRREARAAIIHARIKQRVEELEAPLQAVSRDAGLHKTYLKTLFKRPTAIPKEEAMEGLARALMTSVTWLKGDLSVPGPELPDHLKIREKVARRIAEDDSEIAYRKRIDDSLDDEHDGSRVSISPAVLSALTTPLPPATGEVPPAVLKGDVRGANIEFPAIASLPSDVPVYGTAAGSFARGAFQYEGGVIDYVRRPPGLTGVRTVYSLFIEGNSMAPQHNKGDLRFVDTARRPGRGDSVIVQVRNHEHAQIEAFIGHFLKKTGSKLFIGKLNPEATVELKLEYVIAIHKVLTLNEIFGV